MVCLSIGKGLSIPTNYQNLAGFRTSYSETELRLAIAIAEAFIENGLGSGGGGGGGGITQAQVQAAIEAAANLNGIEPSLASIDTKTPALGANTAANSTPVTLANDGVFAGNFGLNTEAAATSDTGNFSLIRLFKRLLSNGARLLDSAGIIQATIRAGSTNRLATDTALVVTTRDLPIELSGSASAVGDIIPSTDITGYQSFSLQISGTFSGANIVIEGSNNGTIWQAFNYQGVGSSSPSGSAISSSGIYEGKICTKFIRVRLAGIGSGTVNTNLVITKNPSALPGFTNSSLSTSVSNIPTVIVGNYTGIRLQTYAQGTINTSGDNTIIAAPGGSNRIFITAVTVQLEETTATTVLFKSGSTNFRRLFCQNQGDGISLQYHPFNALRLGANEAFILNLSGANLVGYSVEYYTGI